MLDNIGLFKGITGKMEWLNHRQTLISQNVANADTPGYVPSDLKKVDFSALMEVEKNQARLSQSATREGHIGHGLSARDFEGKEQKAVYEAAPDGENAVDLEEQLFKAQSVKADHSLMTNLYRKNVMMLKIAIGKS